MPAKGASHGDCVGGAYEVGCEVTGRASVGAVVMLGLVAAGGFDETKSIMRARDGAACGSGTLDSTGAGNCAGLVAMRRATRSAINLAGS